MSTHDKAGETVVYVRFAIEFFHLQDNEFAWLEDEDTCRHQCERNDKHDSCRDNEAAEQEEAVPSTH
jgi:hypothetical protein